MTIRVDVDAHSSKQAPAGGVFFTQHIPEIVRMEPWGGQFFVACGNPLVKVSVRRRGEPQVDSSGVFGEWKDQTSFGDEGEPSGGCNPPGHRPSHGKQIGGSR